MANDYNMSEKTNRGRAREEATDVKSRQVQLDHLKSLAGRADKVQFVQHISVYLSHMGSRHSWLSPPCLDKYSHFPTLPPEGKMSWAFTWGGSVYLGRPSAQIPPS